MSHVVIETTVPVVVTSDDAHEPPVVVNAVQTTTVFAESAPEVVEVNAGPRGLPGPKGDKGDKGDAGDVSEAPLDGAAYARQSGAWVEALAASARGAAGGVASLDANGKLPESQVPAVAITDVYAVSDQPGMLALDAQRGDIAVRSDINKSFVLQTEPATLLANWVELRTPTDAVLSVAGKTGAVALVLADIDGLVGALAGKADDSVALTDAAGAATLPATAAAPAASRLQVLRNNVKQAFADLAGKADDSAVVKLAGAQTVAGVKTFSDRSAHAGAYTASQQPAHSATPTFDCASSNVFEPAALTGNVTSITLSNAVAGQTVQIRFEQDATGGRTVAVPSGAKVDGSINAGANRVSWLILTYSARGSRWEGNWLQIPS